MTASSTSALPFLVSAAGVDAAAETLAEAFAHEVLWDHVLGEVGGRVRRVLPTYRLMLRHTLHYGEAFALEDFDAVALWLPAEFAGPSLYAELRLGGLAVLRALGPRPLVRLMKVADAMGRVHRRLLEEPHHYLWALGVRKSRQGMGLGSRLLAHGIERFASGGRALYLETHQPKNLPLYQRHGFAVEAHVPGSRSIEQWSMVRCSRAPSST